jgi:predicted acylesterase/phospholipase RssA
MRVLLVLAGVLFVSPLRAQQCPAGPVALVLSGGGAKGLAHIGVLRAMDSLGVRPDLIVGSSMGAVIGAMYASGYSGREIDSLSRTIPLSSLFRTYQPRAPRSLGPLQPLIVWEQGVHGLLLQNASVREARVNALLGAAMLRGNLLARGNFDSLAIPFRAVATDLHDRSAVVLAGGDLAQAVRASIAIPVVFPPERVDGRFLADGGLSANIPERIARQSGATRIIVSDATERLQDSLNLYSPLSVVDRLLGFLFQQPDDTLAPGDLLIRPNVGGFASLDFSRASVARLVQRGDSAATAILGAATCLPHFVTTQRPLPSGIDTVVTLGATLSERRTMLRLLGLQGARRLDVAALRSRVRGLATSEAFEAIWLRPWGRGDSVGFDLLAVPAARRIAGLGLVYDNELGGRMWIGAVDRNLFRLAIEGSAILYLGELRREFALGFRRPYQLFGRLLTPVLTGAVATESIRRFDVDRAEIPSLPTRDVRLFAGVERSLGGDWVASLGGNFMAWRQPDSADSHAFDAVLHIGRSSPAIASEGELNIEWGSRLRRASGMLAPLFRAGAFSIRPYARAGWGRGLPIQYTFALGGTEGFPGVHLGELRGDREAMAGIAMSFRIAGPLIVLAEGATGRSANGGALLGAEGWIAGARGGVGADTPVGPMRIEYGFASGGRDALLVRLGRWF